MKYGWKILAGVSVLVIGICAYTAPLGKMEASNLDAADSYYNLLVQGFRAGHLSLKKEVPPEFVQLADPYDTAANGLYQDFAYKMRDLSYYKGRLYIYFGVTPALILFWPFVALTGHYLPERQAVTIFCAIGILTSLGLLHALWRRYFTGVNAVVVAACALALGFATGIPMILPRSYTHEVATSCGYMLSMLAVAAIWSALHEIERNWRWLATASLMYGLAVGARPSLLFGAVILLVPVAQAWPEWRRVWRLLVAATLPITLIGLGLMLYNAQRFDNPFEFGWRYQLGGKAQVAVQALSPRFLWFNFRVYFLEPARWSARFPFVHQIAMPPLPDGYYGFEDPFGILTNIPLVWLALAAPLALRNRSGQESSNLRWFLAAVTLLFAVCALTIGFYCFAAIRYAIDFLPALMLLAVIGILGLERVLADQPVRRRAVRWSWAVLLGFSVAFSVLVSVVNYAHIACGLATVLLLEGRVPESIQVFEKALRIEPDFADGHYNLGNALQQEGNLQEAIQEYERALRIKPDYADAHLNLGIALASTGRSEDAIQHFRDALRIKPASAVAHLNIGNALYLEGRVPEAIKEFEAALLVRPDYAEAHNCLGAALLRTGNLPDAIVHYEEALRIEPDYADAHYNLGIALAQTGRLDEAIEHWKETLRLNPNKVEAYYNLGGALQRQGHLPEAIEQYRHALKLRADYAPAKNALARLQADQTTR